MAVASSLSEEKDELGIGPPLEVRGAGDLADHENEMVKRAGLFGDHEIEKRGQLRARTST